MIPQNGLLDKASSSDQTIAEGNDSVVRTFGHD